MAVSGALADGTVPVVGMGVSIEDASGSEVALGSVSYLEKGKEEVRVDIFQEYTQAVGEQGFRFAAHLQPSVWVPGRLLRKLGEGVFRDRKAASDAKAKAEAEYDRSPEFLAKLEAGTSDVEPTWPGGSWSGLGALDCFGLRRGMRFRYVGAYLGTSGGGLTYGTVLEIMCVALRNPFYVAGEGGPHAVCVDWGTRSADGETCAALGKTVYIARPFCRLAGRLGQTVREFMTAYTYAPTPSDAEARAQEAYERSFEFLSRLESGTSDFEPTWPQGSWTAAAVLDHYGLRQGMRFRYVGPPTSREDLTHGKVLYIKSVSLQDPFYVPESDGPLAVCVLWDAKAASGAYEIGNAYIARPTGKLAEQFGKTVRDFMTLYEYKDILGSKLQRIVMLRGEPVHGKSVSDSSVRVVGTSMSGEKVAELVADSMLRIGDFNSRFLRLPELTPSDEDLEEVVLVLPDGEIVRDLPPWVMIGDALEA